MLANSPDFSALKDLSIDDLNTLQNQAHQLITQKREAGLVDAYQRACGIAAEVGLSIEELIEVGSKKLKNPNKSRKPVEAKYRNPTHHSETWTGRGLQPKWLKTYLGNGGLLEDCLI